MSVDDAGFMTDGLLAAQAEIEAILLHSSGRSISADTGGTQVSPPGWALKCGERPQSAGDGRDESLN